MEQQLQLTVRQDEPGAARTGRSGVTITVTELLDRATVKTA